MVSKSAWTGPGRMDRVDARMGTRSDAFIVSVVSDLDDVDI